MEENGRGLVIGTVAALAWRAEESQEEPARRADNPVEIRTGRLNLNEHVM
jgi:hypothetical protein